MSQLSSLGRAGVGAVHMHRALLAEPLRHLGQLSAWTRGLAQALRPEDRAGEAPGSRLCAPQPAGQPLPAAVSHLENKEALAQSPVMAHSTRPAGTVPDGQQLFIYFFNNN